MYVGNEGAKPIPILQVEKLVGKQVTFYNVDLLDYNSLSKVFDKVSYIIYYLSKISLCICLDINVLLCSSHLA